VKPVDRVEGVAAVMLRDDIDTDQIFPARFVTTRNYAAALFGSSRYRPDSLEEDPAFLLNREPWRRARILIAGRNFGCGSSREHAVWALRDFGIGAVVAESFNPIFRDNCLRNGVVPCAVDRAGLRDIADRVSRHPTACVAVDVRGRSVAVDGVVVAAFDLAPAAQRMLLEGLDEVALAIDKANAIAAFERADRQRRPWLWPAAGTTPQR
jgi:3-isopropylmalate/(R)-2-methylmalate dehydratase small subunit